MDHYKSLLFISLFYLTHLVAEELQTIIKPYILRRTKAQVALDIPPKSEVTLYHPLSDLQKKYYKAILMKDSGKLYSVCISLLEVEHAISLAKVRHLKQG